MRKTDWTTSEKLIGTLLVTVDRVEIDHGIRDEKGRAIGGYAVIQPELRHTYTASYESDRTGRYQLTVQPTRDGEKFGALTPWTYYATVEDAMAAAETKFAEQRKRYVKKYAK